jgi:RNA polymerase sigma-70 factor (ECF subfamily)
MQAAAAGDEEAFVTLYRTYRDRVFNYTRRLLGSRAEAEEATQETFLKLYAARRRYVPRSRFSTFLFRIATNHCFNQLDRKERRLVDRGADAAELPLGVRPDTEAARHQLGAELRAALAKLPERQAAAIILAHYEGMSYREIGEALEVSENAVKSLVFRARELLLAELRDALPRPEVNHAMP